MGRHFKMIWANAPILDEAGKVVGDIPVHLSSQCLQCKRLRTGLVCEAFPAGIPEAIRTGNWDHSEPFDGDGGVRFKSTGGDQR